MHSCNSGKPFSFVLWHKAIALPQQKFSSEDTTQISNFSDVYSSIFHLFLLSVQDCLSFGLVNSLSVWLLFLFDLFVFFLLFFERFCFGFFLFFFGFSSLFTLSIMTRTTSKCCNKNREWNYQKHFVLCLFWGRAAKIVFFCGLRQKICI